MYVVLFLQIMDEEFFLLFIQKGRDYLEREASKQGWQLFQISYQFCAHLHGTLDTKTLIPWFGEY